MPLARSRWLILGLAWIWRRVRKVRSSFTWGSRLGGSQLGALGTLPPYPVGLGHAAGLACARRLATLGVGFGVAVGAFGRARKFAIEPVWLAGGKWGKPGRGANGAADGGGLDERWAGAEDGEALHAQAGAPSASIRVSGSDQRCTSESESKRVKRCVPGDGDGEAFIETLRGRIAEVVSGLADVRQAVADVAGAEVAVVGCRAVELRIPR